MENPYQAPTELPSRAGAPTPDGLRIALVHAKTGEDWTLCVRDEQIHMGSEDGETYAFSRAEFLQHVRVRPLPQRTCLLIVHSTFLKVDADDLAELKAWLGDEWLVAIARQQRRSHAMVPIVFGAVAVLHSSVVLGVLAIAAAIVWAMSRWKPSRWVFLIDASISTALLVAIGNNIRLGHLSWLWLACCVFLLASALSAIRLFRFFQVTDAPP